VRGKSQEDHFVYQHFNKLCVVGIAPSHLLHKKEKISKVDFHVRDGPPQKLQGKRKKGGTFVEAESPLCEVTSADGSKFIISACIRGHLLETNEALISNPNLIKEKSDTNGFVAIIQPRSYEKDQALIASLISQEEYKKIRHIS